jgi:uncharacterized protein YbjT (DUF2867 family)
MIGIVGATGRVGKALAEQAVARGQAVVALVRAPDQVKGPPARRFEFGDRSTWMPALLGVRTLFLVAPPGDPENAAAEAIAFLELARGQGVEHATFCSARAMVFIDRALSFHRIEAWLAQRSEMSHAILRPSWFMQNFSGLWRPALERGLLTLPAGGGACTWVDVPDVAAVALETLLDPARWNGKVLTLCGPEPLTVADAVERIGQIAGIAATYSPVAPKKWVKTAVEEGVPEGQARFVAYLLQLLAGDSERAVLPDVRRVLGREPGSFEAFVRREFAQRARA